MDTKTRWALSRTELSPNTRIMLAFLADIAKDKNALLHRSALIKTIPVADRSAYTKVLPALEKAGYLEVVSSKQNNKRRTEVVYKLNVGHMEARDVCNPFYLKRGA